MRHQAQRPSGPVRAGRGASLLAAAVALVLLASCIPPPGGGSGSTTTTPVLGPPAGPVELRVTGGSIAIGAVEADLAGSDLTFTGVLDPDGDVVLDAASTTMTPTPVVDAHGVALGATLELRQLSDASGSLDRTTGAIELDLDARLRVAADGSTDFPNVGQGCHIGSNANPIAVALTSGSTNPPGPALSISGQPLGPGGVAELVDNAFGVSGAVGCVLFPLTQFVNEAFGVPSPAGTNSLRLDVELVAPDPV